MMNKYTKKYGCLVLLVCGCMAFQAGAADSVNVTFNMSVPVPTCNISISGGGINNGVVSLGELTRNTTDTPHSSFKVSADCNGYVGPSGNYLLARVMNGSLQNDNVRVAVQMGSNPVNTTAGPFLKLKNSNTDVKLDGTTKFCKSSNNTLECTLTPHTTVLAGAPTGSGSATIQFTVNYQA